MLFEEVNSASVEFLISKVTALLIVQISVHIEEGRAEGSACDMKFHPQR
jgi:hypothetical protein